MRRIDWPAIGETLYTTKLPNGLPIFVVPKPGYRKSFACYMTTYGGADRPRIPPPAWPIISSTRCSTCPRATP